MPYKVFISHSGIDTWVSTQAELKNLDIVDINAIDTYFKQVRKRVVRHKKKRQ